VRFVPRRTAKGVTRRLTLALSVAFFCRVPRENAQQRLFIMRCQARHKAKGLYRAKCYRVPFVMRPDEKRTTKSLSCILGPLPCAYGARQTHYFP
jgi:hypothetical protein